MIDKYGGNNLPQNFSVGHTSVSQEAGEIERLIELLRSNINSISDLRAVLRSRLSPVMLGRGCDDQKFPQPTEPISSPLAAKLRGLARDTQDIIADIHDIISSLEI